jgi:hypothetical protein
MASQHGHPVHGFAYGMVAHDLLILVGLSTMLGVILSQLSWQILVL